MALPVEVNSCILLKGATSVKRTLVRAAAVTTMATAALTGMTAPASAGPAPSCVWVDVHQYYDVTVWNQCTRALRLQVDWGWAAPDSHCYTIAAGQFRRISAGHQPLAQYTKVFTC